MFFCDFDTFCVISAIFAIFANFVEKKHSPSYFVNSCIIGMLDSSGNCISTLEELLGQKKPKRSFAEKYFCCFFAKKHWLCRNYRINMLLSWIPVRTATPQPRPFDRPLPPIPLSRPHAQTTLNRRRQMFSQKGLKRGFVGLRGRQWAATPGVVSEVCRNPTGIPADPRFMQTSRFLQHA